VDVVAERRLDVRVPKYLLHDLWRHFAICHGIPRIPANEAQLHVCHRAGFLLHLGIVPPTTTDNSFVVVRVCRDAHSDFSRELDRRLYGLNNRRVSSGKLIVVATMEGDYQEELAKKIALVRP
jgi:hypothetical protein